MFNLYFAGKITKAVNTELYNLGINQLFSYMNDRGEIDHWVGLMRKYGKKGKLFIDSGAFTAWTQNKYINVDDYIHFINDRADCIDYYGQVDAIPGTITRKPTIAEIQAATKKTWDNYIYMYYRMVNPKGLMYTFHVGEPYWQLKRALMWKDKNGEPMECLALGGMVGKNRETQLEFIEKCFSIIKHSPNPNIKVHAFGLIAPNVLEAYPFYSADSSGWLQVGQNGSVYIPEGVLLVSDQQISHKDHIYNQSDEVIAKYKKYFEEHGYTLEGLAKSYAQRSVWNTLFLTEWAKNYSGLQNKIIRRRLF